MKKFSILFCSLVAVIMMSSCSTEINTVANSRTANVHYRAAKVMPVNMGIKVDYDKRVQYVSEVINIKNVGGKDGALEVAKFDCLYKNNMDVLIDPIYKITKYDNKNVIVMLQAHPGYYVEAPACTMSNHFAAPVGNMKGMHKPFGKKHGKKYGCHGQHNTCATPFMPMQCPMQGMQHHHGNCQQGMKDNHHGDCQQKCQGGDKGQCKEKCNKEGGECQHK